VSRVPSVRIRTSNLSMSVKATKGRARNSNVVNAFTKCFEKRETYEKKLLNKINVSFEPKEFTLLLGPPGAGKSTLLRTIAGLVAPSEMKQSGEVMYNNDAMDERLKRDLPSIVGYVDQRDMHYPLLTVAETLMFAQDCMLSQNRILSASDQLPSKIVVRALDRATPLVLEGRDAATFRCYTIMTMLGIGDCANTVVGDEMTRGISGGQKKRVTIAEMIIGNRPVILLDEITTGLDSSTAFDIIQSFKRINHIFGYTVVAALLQPPPEVYDLFDRVCLLDQGRVMYHGPREDVVKHFTSLGYRIPERMDIADALQQITLPEGAKFKDSGKHLTRDEFAQEYKKNFKLVEGVVPDLPKTLHYSQSPYASAMTVFRRQWILTVRNRAFAVSQIVQSLIQGFLIGTVFFGLSSSDYITRYGFCFTTMMALSLAAMAQIPQIIKERTVYYKQRSANFFRTQTYVWASVLSQIPFSLVTTTCMSLLVYFMTDMQNTFQAYIFFWSILFFLSMGMGMLFKFFAAAMPDATSAQGLASCSVLILVLMSGYIIQQDEIKPVFKWLYYLSPLQYGYSALMINEFMSGRYDEKIPASLSQGKTETYGEAYLAAYQMHTTDSYKMYSLIYCAGLCVVSFFAMWGAYHFIDHSKSGQDQMGSSDDDDDDDMVVEDYVKGKNTLRDPLLDTKEEKEDLTLNVRDEDDDDDFDLGFKSVELAFKNLKYTVTLPKTGRDKVLLQNINGYATPGRLTALMGSTGAGKSTLLDVLAGRKNTGKIEGVVTTNGFLKNDDNFATVCGYVEQVDIHSPTATVRGIFFVCVCIHVYLHDTCSFISSRFAQQLAHAHKN